jgi:hypothetical protein
MAAPPVAGAAQRGGLRLALRVHTLVGERGFSVAVVVGRSPRSERQHDPGLRQRKWGCAQPCPCSERQHGRGLRKTAEMGMRAALPTLGCWAVLGCASGFNSFYLPRGWRFGAVWFAAAKGAQSGSRLQTVHFFCTKVAMLRLYRQDD